VYKDDSTTNEHSREVKSSQEGRFVQQNPSVRRSLLKLKRTKSRPSCNTPLNIRLLNYNSLVRPRIEYGIVTWGGVYNYKL